MTIPIVSSILAGLSLIAVISCIWDPRQKHNQASATQEPQWTELDRIEAAKRQAKAEIKARRQQTEDQLRRLSRWYM